MSSSLPSLDALVDGLERLAQADNSPAAEFYRCLLEQVVTGLAAAGGAIWAIDATGEVRLEQHTDLVPTGLTPDDLYGPPHRQMLDVVNSSAGPIAIPPTGSTSSVGNANPTPWLVLAVSMCRDSESRLVLEVFQRPDVSPAAQAGALRLLELVRDLIESFHSRRQSLDARPPAQWLVLAEQFALRVHQSLDLQTTAYTVVNEGRVLIGCDRLSLMQWRRARCRLLATSGQETFDPRANLVRRMEDLATTTIAAGEPLWHREDGPELAPQIEAVLHPYLDAAHARTLAVLPLQTAGPLLGCLVLEWFAAERVDEGLRRRAETVRRHSELAVRNAWEHRSLPLFPLLRGLQRSHALVQAGQLPRTVLVLAVLIAAVLALVLIPADFEVTGRGELQPVMRRDVFASADGVVREVLARHGQRVAAGEPLVALRRNELDFEFSRVLGEMQTARARLAAVQASRLQPSRMTAESLQKEHELAAEEEELKELLKGLQRQHEILTAQQQELIVRSPIDGEMMTWNVEPLLTTRPVRRGQRLLQVADRDGPWELEIHVPDNQIGHVLGASQENRSPRPVSFVLASEPNTVYRGTVETIAMTTHPGDSEREAFVLVTVRIDRDEIAHLRPGTTVIPRIDCGLRSLGYVWFHELIDFVRTRVLF